MPADRIAGRRFGPGLAPTGEDASLVMHPDHVEIRSAQGGKVVPLAALRLREVVSADSGLELAWDEPRGPAAVQVFDPLAMERLRRHPVLGALPGMRRRRSGRPLLLGLIGLLALPAVLLAVLLWNADRIVDAIAGRIPVGQEQQFGRRMFERMRSSLQLQPEGPEVDLVNHIGQRLAQQSRYEFEFHVAEDPSINAFALPGGVIVVHTGLLQATRRPEELAGVLAHEIQHVELRHSLKAMIRRTGLAGLWALATGDLGGSLAGRAALEITSLRFSRDAEREADARGFETLVRHDIDPAGMVEFFGTMAREAGPSPPAWLSTHPASDSRREALRGMQQELGNRSFPPLAP